MPQPHKYDLTFVAPHKRNEVLRRILVLKRFLAGPGTRLAAEAAAQQLGLRPTQFYRLAKAWRETESPEAIDGAAKPRTRRSPVSDGQRSIVLEAERLLPDGTINAVVKKAAKIAAERGIRLPSPNTVRKIIAEARQGKLPANSPAAGADLVVVHCVIDLPVDMALPRPAMPLATLIIRTDGEPSVLGVALSDDGPAAEPTARALIEALAKKRLPKTTGRPIRVAVDGYGGPGWMTISEALSRAGFVLLGQQRTEPISGRDAVSLLGPRPCGMSLRPGLVAHPPSTRPATLPAGGRAIDMAEAEDLVRGRLTTLGAPSRPSAGLPAPARDRLLRKLANVAGNETANN